MGEGSDAWDRVSPEEWATFRQCRFAPRTFHPYPCLRMIPPATDEGGTLWAPYRGGPYDPTVYELVEGGWDHEHCEVCFARIGDGDRYWANDGPEHVDLCLTCYPVVQRRLQAESGAAGGRDGTG